MAKKKMDTVIKIPSKCTSDELDKFQKLVVEGGEVTSYRLRQRIEQAAALVFIGESECVAVGAIKNPNQSYKQGVFSKAGIANQSNNYIYELGWLYVAPAARGKGIGHSLMQAVASYIGSVGCYATTREDNNAMHNLFSQYNFSRIGAPYTSTNGYSLVLYASKS